MKTIKKCIFYIERLMVEPQYSTSLEFNITRLRVLKKLYDMLIREIMDPVGFVAHRHVAMAMGTHERLGLSSIFNRLNAELVEFVANLDL